MSAIQLFHQDGVAAGVWYCNTCRAIYPGELGAENCHGNGTCACGKPTQNRFSRQCIDCESRDWRERLDREEADRFEKATKVRAADWKGDQIYWKDEYFSSIDDFLECHEDTPLPLYVWAAVDQGAPKADIDDLLDRVVEGLWDDADYGDLNGVEELQQTVEAFNEANKCLVVYTPDFSTAILMDAHA